MPSKSKSQQRLFGMVRAYQEGKMKKPPEKVKEVAEHVEPSTAHEFAATESKDLPEHKKEASFEGLTAMLPYIGGVMQYCIDNKHDANTAYTLLKAAAQTYSIGKYGDTALLKFAEGLGQPAPAAQPNPNQPNPAGSAGQTVDPEEQATLAKPVPSNPFDFRNHPAVLMMQKRQKDLLQKKQQETQQAKVQAQGLI